MKIMYRILLKKINRYLKLFKNKWISKKLDNNNYIFQNIKKFKKIKMIFNNQIWNR